MRNNLSARQAAYIKRTRAAIEANQIAEIFDNFKGVLEDIDTCLIFNYDEINVQDDLGVKKVVVLRITKPTNQTFNNTLKLRSELWYVKMMQDQCSFLTYCN